MNAARDMGVFVLYEEMNLGTVDAVPEVDGPKLGNEVKAEIHDVRRDKTKVNQSAGLSGTIEVEHQAAGQVAGSQTRP